MSVWASGSLSVAAAVALVAVAVAPAGCDRVHSLGSDHHDGGGGGQTPMTEGGAGAAAGATFDAGPTDHLEVPPAPLACDPPCAGGQTCVASLCQDGVSRWPMFGGDIHHTGVNRAETGHPPLTVAWRTPVSDRALHPAVSDGTRVYAINLVEDDNNVHTVVATALAPADGHAVWRHDFGMVLCAGPPAVDAEHVYVSSCGQPPVDAYMYALVSADGKAFWSQPISQRNSWAPVIVGARLYFNETCGLMLSLALADGGPVFREAQVVCGDGFFSPLYLNGALYTVSDGAVWRLDPTTGMGPRSWEAGTPNPGRWKAAPVSDGEKIYVVSAPGLHAFVPGQTKPAWSVVGSYAGMPAVAGGVVYAISGGQLRANDARTGDILWTVAADNRLAYPPVIAGRWIYVASDQTVYAIDLDSQEIVWRGAPGGWLAIASGQLYVAQADGVLSAYDLTH